MNEASRLEKIRNLGVRLHELKLVTPEPGKSYASVALNYLFASHDVPRPAGKPLDYTLKTLGDAITVQKNIRFSTLDADAVIDFFCRLYRVH